MASTLDALWRMASLQDSFDEMAKVPALRSLVTTAPPKVREPLRTVRGTPGDFIPTVEEAASAEILAVAGPDLAGGFGSPLREWPRLIAYVWAVAGHDGERPVFGDVHAHALLLDAARRAEARARSGELPAAVRHQDTDVLRESAALATLLLLSAWDTVKVFAALLRFRRCTGNRRLSEWALPPSVSDEPRPVKRDPEGKEARLKRVLIGDPSLLAESPKRIGEAAGLPRSTVQEIFKRWGRSSDPTEAGLAETHRADRAPAPKHRSTKTTSRSRDGEDLKELGRFKK